MQQHWNCGIHYTTSQTKMNLSVTWNVYEQPTHTKKTIQSHRTSKTKDCNTYTHTKQLTLHTKSCIIFFWVGGEMVVVVWWEWRWCVWGSDFNWSPTWNRIDLTVKQKYGGLTQTLICIGCPILSSGWGTASRTIPEFCNLFHVFLFFKKSKHLLVYGTATMELWE